MKLISLSYTMIKQGLETLVYSNTPHYGAQCLSLGVGTEPSVSGHLRHIRMPKPPVKELSLPLSLKISDEIS